MFLDHYRLEDCPFGETPDPKFLFLSRTHREALASLFYAITAGRGFAALIAQPGMGKTTLLFMLLQQLNNAARTVFIFQTQCSPRDFLRSLMADLGMEQTDGDIVRLHAELNRMLLEESRSGRRFVLVIDEAQNLDPSVLELVRMLSNFETRSHKLIQVILAGQPQLADRLDLPELLQLRQRISTIATVQPFTEEETKIYICHRLRVAGCDRPQSLFTKEATAMVAKFSGGIPRNINNICFNALSLGCALQQEFIDADIIREVLADSDLSSLCRAATANAAAKPVNQGPSQISNRASRGRRENTWSGWARKIALVTALLLEFAWPASIEKATMTSKSTLPAVFGTVPSITNSSGPKYPGSAKPAPTEATDTVDSETASGAVSVGVLNSTDTGRSVRVFQNQTLYRISMDNLGKYDRITLRTIRKLNPWLVDPSRIQSGTTIRLPALADVPKQFLPTSPTNSFGSRLEHK